MQGLTELDGKVGVVTGGASGIGRGIAERLRAHGMKVVIADIEEGALKATADEIGATPIRTDVTDAASVANLADEVIGRFGAVHVVCNNAGVGSVSKIADMTLADWRWMIDVNLWGVIHGVASFLPLLNRNPDGGWIVNTSSMGGLATMPTLGGYAVTKFGVVALSETLSQELAMDGSKVGVTVLCPGTVRTNIKASSRNRPSSSEPAGLQDVDLEGMDVGIPMRWIEPPAVGEIVVQAIRKGDLYAFTHPDMAAPIEQRHAAINAALKYASQA